MLFLLTDPPQKSKLEKIRGNLIIFVYVTPKKEVAMSPKIGRMNIFLSLTSPYSRIRIRIYVFS